MENNEVVGTNAQENQNSQVTEPSKADKALAYGLLAGGVLGTVYFVKDKAVPFFKKLGKNISDAKAEKKAKKETESESDSKSK